MATSVLERTRQLHDDIDRREQALVALLDAPPKSVRGLVGFDVLAGTCQHAFGLRRGVRTPLWTVSGFGSSIITDMYLVTRCAFILDVGSGDGALFAAQGGCRAGPHHLTVDKGRGPGLGRVGEHLPGQGRVRTCLMCDVNACTGKGSGERCMCGVSSDLATLARDGVGCCVVTQTAQECHHCHHLAI
jgi:hypothetical protein